MSDTRPVSQVSVSIIIVNYKTLGLLQRCLDRVFESRNGVPMDVTVVDNASQGGEIEDLCRSYGEVKLLRNEHNLGFARGINQGIRNTAGTYVLAMNPDTRLPREGIGPLLAFAEEKYRTDRCGIVGCGLLNEDGSLQFSRGRFPSLRRTLRDVFRSKGRRKYQLEGYAEAAEADWVTGACVLLRRDLLESVGFLDENFFMYYEDVDLCLRARREGWKTFYYPGTKVFHFFPHAQRKENPDFVPVEIRRSHLYFYKKHYSRIEYATLVCLTAGFALGMVATAALRRLVSNGCKPDPVAVGTGILRDIFSNGKTRGRAYSVRGEAVWPHGPPPPAPPA